MTKFSEKPVILDVDVVSRNKRNHSAAAAYAYISGSCITCTKTGDRYDFRRKSDVDFGETFIPNHSPEWVADLSALASKIEEANTRINARLLTTVVLGLPREFTEAQMRLATRKFAEHFFLSLNLVTSAWYHGTETKNPHVHLNVPTRSIEEGGTFSGLVCREIKRKTLVSQMRNKWAEICNDIFQRAGLELYLNPKPKVINYPTGMTQQKSKKKRVKKSDPQYQESVKLRNEAKFRYFLQNLAPELLLDEGYSKSSITWVENLSPITLAKAQLHHFGEILKSPKVESSPASIVTDIRNFLLARRSGTNYEQGEIQEKTKVAAHHLLGEILDEVSQFGQNKHNL